MFKAENTGSPAWKRVLDDAGNHIANLDELYNSDWALVKLGSRDLLTPSSFSNASRAISWLWKNRLDLGEPFASYAEKTSKKVQNAIEVVVPVEEPSEDLFWNYKK